MDAQVILLILMGVAVVFGLGTVVVGRRSRRTDVPVAAPSVAEPEVAPSAPVDDAPTVPDVAVKKTFRESIGRTAVAMAGVFGGVRARVGITAET